MKNLIRISCIITVLLITSSCDSPPEEIPTKPKVNVPKPNVPIIEYTVVNSIPHSTNSFTQGLLIHDGKIYESTGSPFNFPQTKSVIGVLNEDNGAIDVKTELDKKVYFGEGITILNDKVYQLTYKRQTCFVYDLKTFKKLKTFNYSNEEGWGLTTDGEYLIMSDGIYNLEFRDKETFDVVRSVPVTENKTAVFSINELEYINGYIYANVWMTDYVLKIDPKTGYVMGKIDLSDLKEQAISKHQNSQETNGIAYNKDSNTLLVTGKLWPLVFEIKLSE